MGAAYGITWMATRCVTSRSKVVSNLILLGALSGLCQIEGEEFEIASGRRDDAKVGELLQHFSSQGLRDEVFVCGPDSMIGIVTGTLADLGVDRDGIHAERFGAPRKTAQTTVWSPERSTRALCWPARAHRRVLRFCSTTTRYRQVEIGAISKLSRR